MESIYWVITWACHRRCLHCYDDRFRPYHGAELARVVGEGRASWRAILANLPDDFSWLDPSGTTEVRRRGQLILAGGEVLLDGVREELFYPILDAIRDRWGEAAPRIGIQTTGDIMTPRHIDEMILRGVHTIAIASIDDHHAGMQGDRKFRFMERVRGMMKSAGVEEISLGGRYDRRLAMPEPKDRRLEKGPFFLFFGAQPELWIGELWPRGRAMTEGLSKAGWDDNFCARWSGGRSFLEYGRAGSEVAIEPDGAVYPCCLKTKAPLGSLAEERLIDILDDLRTEPALAAINEGDPERMGETYGWSRADFEARSHVTDGKGEVRRNLCLGCDVFFEEKLAAVLTARRKARLERAGAPAKRSVE